jgi:hypothetical protein
MSHKSGHIIINAATPVQVAGAKTNGGIAGVVLFAVGVLVGALLL